MVSYVGQELARANEQLPGESSTSMLKCSSCGRCSGGGGDERCCKG